MAPLKLIVFFGRATSSLCLTILPWGHARGDPTGDDGGVCGAIYDDFCAILCLADAHLRLPLPIASPMTALQVEVPLPAKTKSVSSLALPSSK